MTAVSRDMRWWWVTLSVLCMAILVVALDARAARERERAIQSALRATRTELTERTRNEAGYREVLERQLLNAPVLTGVDIRTGSRIDVSTDTPRLVYLIQSTCAACDLNYPFLEELSEHAPGSVIVIGMGDDTQTLRDYVAARALGVPVLADPAGSLMSLAPRHGTPITLVVRADKITTVIPGRISVREQEGLRRFFGVGGRQEQSESWLERDQGAGIEE